MNATILALTVIHASTLQEATRRAVALAQSVDWDPSRFKIAELITIGMSERLNISAFLDTMELHFLQSTARFLRQRPATAQGRPFFMRLNV